MIIFFISNLQWTGEEGGEILAEGHVLFGDMPFRESASWGALTYRIFWFSQEL